MHLRIKPVNFNELHNRETYLIVSGEGDRDLRIDYALVIYRRKENSAKTPYVCFYMGITTAELGALRQIGCHEYSFLGIPNDSIDVSHEVTRIYLEAKPEAFVGIDRPDFDESEFESFVRRVLDLKGLVKWNRTAPSSSSSKTLLESPTATKESSAAFAEQRE